MPIASRFAPIASRFTPIASRFAPIASRFTPIASRFTPIASRFAAYAYSQPPVFFTYNSHSHRNHQRSQASHCVHTLVIKPVADYSPEGRGGGGGKHQQRLGINTICPNGGSSWLYRLRDYIYISGFAPDATATIGERIIDHKQYTAYTHLGDQPCC